VAAAAVAALTLGLLATRSETEPSTETATDVATPLETEPSASAGPASDAATGTADDDQASSGVSERSDDGSDGTVEDLDALDEALDPVSEFGLGTEQDPELALTELLASIDSSAEPTTVGFDQPREIDRMIELFTERAAERGQSLEYRRLGDLLLERAGLDATLADYRGALEAYTRAVELDPSPANWIGQGRAALGVHDFDTAQAASESVTNADPDLLDGLLLAADVGFALEDPALIDEPLDALRSRAGNDPAVLVRQAELATLRGGDDAAADAEQFGREALEQAVAIGLDGGDLAYYQTYAGRLAFDRGDYGAATELLEAALVNAPDDHGTLGELARVRAATGRTDEALRLLERANALVPEPDHVVLQGDLRGELGDRDGASADYQAALELTTLDADWARAWGHSVIAELLNDPTAEPAIRAEQEEWAQLLVDDAADLDPVIGRDLADQLADEVGQA
jgi:tetratricopeptide (TPR) repeat protein